MRLNAVKDAINGDNWAAKLRQCHCGDACLEYFDESLLQTLHKIVWCILTQGNVLNEEQGSLEKGNIWEESNLCLRMMLWVVVNLNLLRCTVVTSNGAGN